MHVVVPSTTCSKSCKHINLILWFKDKIVRPPSSTLIFCKIFMATEVRGSWNELRRHSLRAVYMRRASSGTRAIARFKRDPVFVNISYFILRLYENRAGPPNQGPASCM
jgi:hypothetical protein